MKKRIKENYQLIISFLLPLLIMSIYFIYRHMAPFGKSSLLTVDLGQQYIDFFSFFHNTLLHHPGSLFYSFSKALGGETTSIWAYYLLSPFNLILLFFSKSSLTTAVFIITVIKYGFSGLSIAWVLQKVKLISKSSFMLPAFATSYALCGWIIANQLNLMWLDALITLPLVIYGLEKLVTDKNPVPYVIWLSITLIVNYYMAYMICIFTILYIIFALIYHEKELSNKPTTIIRSYIFSSITSGLISACLLLPTYILLKNSKMTFSLKNTKSIFEYNPLKIIGKLYPGSFNFKQMPSGQPNIFVGSLIIILLIAFFTTKKINLKTKLTSLIITLFLLLSTCFKPLDLFWHAGQFPIWYPSRFSFIICFWFIWLAAIYWSKQKCINNTTLITSLILLILSDLYLFINENSFNFIKNNQIIIGSIFFLVVLCLLTNKIKFINNYLTIILLIISVIDMTTNASMSLNNLSYVPQNQFGIYTNQIDKASAINKNINSGFYRIGTTFQRTRDDGMQGDYFTPAHFGSTLERKTIGFFDLIGLPDGDGFVNYSNGTLLTDALLNLKYFWTYNYNNPKFNDDFPQITVKPDLTRYPIIKNAHPIIICHNPYALNVGYMVNKKINKLKYLVNDDVTNQNQLWNYLLNKPQNNKLIKVDNFNNLQSVNTSFSLKVTNNTFHKLNNYRPAQITLSFIPKTNDPYYLNIGPNINYKNVSMLLNGQPLNQYKTFRNNILLNVSDKDKRKKQTITFQFLKNDLWLQNVTLYHLDMKQFNTGIKTLKSHQFKVTSWGQTFIKGTVNATKKQTTLMTSIPYELGWHATVDGKKASLHKVADEFIAINLKPGNHNIELYYRTPFLGLGIFLSCIGLFILAILIWKIYFENKKAL